MERIPTGISGLDEMLRGGLPEGRTFLVCGGPGAGKTILSMQFLLEGVKNKEKGLFIALEEQSTELIEDMKQFGWDLSKIKIIDTTQEVSSGVWALKTDSVVSRPELNLPNIINTIQTRLQDYKPKRIVIDSVTSIRMLYNDPSSVRKDILSLINFLSKTGCTTLLTMESFDGAICMEEFLVSGVLKIVRIEKEGETLTTIKIEKMRGISFDKHTRPMKINENGIVVFPKETIFM